MSSHFNDLYEFNPLNSLWRHIKPHGIVSPVCRRRQVCLVIDHRMYMFGGTSPISTVNHSNEFEHLDDIRTRLQDQSDLYVFDFCLYKITLKIVVLSLFNHTFSFSFNIENIMFTIPCTKNVRYKSSSEEIS